MFNIYFKLWGQDLHKCYGLVWLVKDNVTA